MKKNKVAIMNGKGGVAKSTSVANLASVSAQQGFKTLILDYDPQAHATYLSGVEDFQGFSSMLIRPPKGKDDLASISDVVLTIRDNLDIVPAGPDLISTDDYIRQKTMGELELSRNLQDDPVINDYDIVWIDTPGYRGRLFTSVLNACDYVVMPLNASALSTNEIPEMEEIISELNQYRFGREPIDFKAVFFANVIQNTNATLSNIADVKDYFEGYVAENIIPRATAIEEAALLRKPVVQHDPKCKASIAYQGLFNELKDVLGVGK